MISDYQQGGSQAPKNTEIHVQRHDGGKMQEWSLESGELPAPGSQEEMIFVSG